MVAVYDLPRPPAGTRLPEEPAESYFSATIARVFPDGTIDAVLDDGGFEVKGTRAFRRVECSSYNCTEDDLGDGYCDDECNHAACDFDGGTAICAATDGTSPAHSATFLRRTASTLGTCTWIQQRHDPTSSAPTPCGQKCQPVNLGRSTLP